MRRQQVTDPESNYSSYEYKLFLEKRSRNELIEILMMQKDEKIPLSIFQNDMGPLEAVVKFLKEEKNISITRISRMLNRSDKTIWATYSKVKDHDLKISQSRYYIPVSLLAKKKLSILESIVYHLKISENLGFHQIAILLHRDDRTVWTVYSRAVSKNSQKQTIIRKVFTKKHE